MDPRRLIPALTAAACALVATTLVVVVARPDPASEPPSRQAAPQEVARPQAPPTGPSAVLAAWDDQRAAAWSAGDPAALGRLYADGSRTGAVDVRLLRDYRERGLHVQGLTTQVLALRVVARSPARLELVVTDRVVGGTAVGSGGRVALPADRASTRQVVLVRTHGRWVVSEARAQDNAAASTSRTSSSSKS